MTLMGVGLKTQTNRRCGAKASVEIRTAGPRGSPLVHERPSLSASFRKFLPGPNLVEGLAQLTERVPPRETMIDDYERRRERMPNEAPINSKPRRPTKGSELPVFGRASGAGA